MLLFPFVTVETAFFFEICEIIAEMLKYYNQTKIFTKVQYHSVIR